MTDSNDEYEAEEWRPVRGYEDLYLVSNLGRMKRLTVYGHPVNRILKRRLNILGYVIVSLSKNNKEHGRFVHLLMTEAFWGPKPTHLQCAHLDGDPGNCRLTNIKWVTPKENNAHKKLHGTNNNGERHCLSKLTDTQAMQIINLFKANPIRGTQSKLAKKFGVSGSCIYSLVKGHTWKHLSR